MKFYGKIEELNSKLNDHGIAGEWKEGVGHHKFSTKDGGILLWYENGTLLCQGKEPSKNKIFNIVKDAENWEQSQEQKVEEKHSNIFVVYGHDLHSRDQLELLLSKININDPFILGKTSGKGLTIIEALEQHLSRDGEANVGIVLLTPDDMGYSVKDGEGSIRGRARQNVILEMGMLLSKLGREHTIILVKGNIERPSDLDGIIYLQYDNHIKEVFGKLCDRLEGLGVDIDHKKLTKILS